MNGLVLYTHCRLFVLVILVDHLKAHNANLKWVFLWKCALFLRYLHDLGIFYQIIFDALSVFPYDFHL